MERLMSPETTVQHFRRTLRKMPDRNSVVFTKYLIEITKNYFEKSGTVPGGICKPLIEAG